jgi:Ras GTPase-activating protein 1
MEIVNPFILKNKNRMIKYLDDLAIIDSSIDDHHKDCMTDSLRNSSEPSRELAAIHSICEQHFEEIIQLSQNRVKTIYLFIN